MKLNIFAPNKVVYQGDFSTIILPSLEGQISVLRGHVPLITSLKEGRIKIKKKEKESLYFDIEKGVLEVNPKEVNILVVLKKMNS